MTYIRADLGTLANMVDVFAQAKSAYDAAHQTWQQASADMSAQLNWLREVLATAHGNFSSALTATTTMWEGS